MIGHDTGKRGTWYEEDYIVLQLLRLLNGELESVTWKVAHEDGEGIDCLLKEGAGAVAVQCKTRSTGSWTLRRLEAEGVLRHAADRLEGRDDLRFRFVSDAPAPELKRPCQEARSTDDAERWWANLPEKAKGTLQRSWLVSEGAKGTVKAHQLAARIEVKLLDEKGLDQHVDSLARALSPEPRRVVNVLRQLARGSLTRRLREPEVRRRLEREGVGLQPRPADPAVHDRLKSLREGFLLRVENTRGPFPLLERQETENVVERIVTGEPTRILVHGPAGCGKSEVIAAVLHRLDDEGVPVLVLTPDVEPAEIGLGDDPVAALARYAAGGTAVLVIDQYDQVLLAGQEAQRLLRRCHEWIRRAKELEISIVIGARTAEAKADTQLEGLLGGEGPKVFVHDLEEPEAAAILAERGIALASLDVPLRRLLLRPLALRLALDLHGKGVSLTGLESLVSLVDRWWNTIAVGLPGIKPERAATALDGLLLRMEADGVMSVRADGLSDREALDTLVRAGVLVEEIRSGAEHLRPFHQVLADVRIALSWRNVHGAEDLINRLGPMESQSLHQARRLRLAVPLLLEHPTGVGILRETVASGRVRPILIQSVFLALATIEQPGTELVELVEEWLCDSSLRPRVLATVVRGQCDWVQALSDSGYLDKVWEAEYPFSREPMLDLLASVSQQWPDGVATHLKRWQAIEPSTLEWASRIFSSAPGKDSNALFELRIEYLARNVKDDPYWDWTTLLQKAPRRAVRLLEVLLTRENVDILTPNGPVWISQLPTPDEIPLEAAEIGRFIWDRLSAWWLALELRDGLLLVPTAQGGLEEGALPRLVELLAAGIAHELASDPGFLETLLREMPSPLREQDAWLLLRAGARLPEYATEAADALARWFMSDPRWAAIEVGHIGSGREVAEFVERIGTAVSDEMSGALEEYLLEYREPWTHEDEEQRIEWQKQVGKSVPSRLGWTAYRLLPLLPAERLSLRAQRRIDELRRKFGEGEPQEIESTGVHVRSPVPDEIAARWSAEEWLRYLRDPRLPVHWSTSAKLKQAGPRAIGVYSLSTLTTQLGYLARRTPKRYLPLALRMEPDIPWQAREKLLFALCPSQRPSELAADEPWEPLEDEEVASIVLRPAYLDEPAADRLLAWVVADRPEYRWPESIRERLAWIARAMVQAGISSDHGLAAYRLNENGCAALDAIAALARHHEALRPWALGIAGEIARHDDAGRRASAGAIAAACVDGSSKEAVKLVLQVATDPLVAAEREVIHGLFQLALGGEEVKKPARWRATALLLAMAGHPNEYVAGSGGQAAVWLRHRGVIGNGEIEKAMEAGVPTRRGMARVVQQLLIGSPPPPWLQKLAIELVSDTDQQTGRTVLFAFLKSGSAHLFSDREFVERLIAAALDSNHDLIPVVEACDRQACLQPVARVVLNMARELAGAPYNRRWREADELTGLLARLVEESEREQDFGLRNQALDAWDALLEANVPLARVALAFRLDQT